MANPVNPWAPKAAGNGLTGGISLDAATPTPKAAGNGTTGGVSTDEWGGGATPTPQAAGESAYAKSYILDPDKYNSMIRPGGSFKTNAPTIADFMKATGSDFQTAADTISGVVGRAPDMRDWDAIMGSDDPLSAASQATGQFFAPGDHRGVVADTLSTIGYKPINSGQYGTKPLAQAGNFSVLDRGKTPSGQRLLSLQIAGNEGFAGPTISWDNKSIADAAKLYGIPMSSLSAIADQLDAAGVSYMPGQMGQGGNIGADLRGLAAGAGTAPAPQGYTTPAGQNPYYMMADQEAMAADHGKQGQGVLEQMMAGLLNPQRTAAPQPGQGSSPYANRQPQPQAQTEQPGSKSGMTNFMGLSGAGAQSPLMGLLMMLMGK
jgi:hypothetical protein